MRAIYHGGASRRATSHAEQAPQVLDELGRAARAAGDDEDRVVARERAEDVRQVRVVEGARDRPGGAGLRAHDHHEAVRLDRLGEAPHGLDRQSARVVLDMVARPRGSRAAPHAERREIARQRRLRGADAARAQVPLQLILARDGPAREDLADGVAAGSRSSRRRAGAGHQVTSVPTPRSVKSSASTLCATRPSTMCTAFTPSASAVRMACALTCIPPLMAPAWPSMASRSPWRIWEMRLPSPSRMPATSVRKMRRSAPQAAAISPAATSAL